MKDDGYKNVIYSKVVPSILLLATVGTFHLPAYYHVPYIDAVTYSNYFVIMISYLLFN